MKRLLALLAILLISQVGYGQQKMDQLFNAFRGESDVTSVNIGNITMKLASLFTETMGVNGIEILEFVRDYRHKVLIPAAMLISIITLVLGQLLVTHIFTFRTTLSIIVNFVGGVYFIYLLLRANKKWQ